MLSSILGLVSIALSVAYGVTALALHDLGILPGLWTAAPAILKGLAIGAPVGLLYCGGALLAYGAPFSRSELRGRLLCVRVASTSIAVVALGLACQGLAMKATGWSAVGAALYGVSSLVLFFWVFFAVGGIFGMHDDLVK